MRFLLRARCSFELNFDGDVRVGLKNALGRRNREIIRRSSLYLICDRGWVDVLEAQAGRVLDVGNVLEY